MRACVRAQCWGTCSRNRNSRGRAVVALTLWARQSTAGAECAGPAGRPRVRRHAPPPPPPLGRPLGTISPLPPHGPLPFSVALKLHTALPVAEPMNRITNQPSGIAHPPVDEAVHERLVARVEDPRGVVLRSRKVSGGEGTWAQALSGGRCKRDV